jgi:hypothetical protein
VEDNRNGGTTSGEKSGDGNGDREREESERGGEDDGNGDTDEEESDRGSADDGNGDTVAEESDRGSADDGNVGGNVGANNRSKKSLDGRNIRKALQANPRTTAQRVSSWVSPFNKDIWKQNPVDEKLELQLWEKIINNEEYARYILYL